MILVSWLKQEQKHWNHQITDIYLKDKQDILDHDALCQFDT